MWENNRFVKMSGRSVSPEFRYDFDMLEMIRWPSMEDETPDLYEAMSSSCQGLGPYEGLFSFPHLVPRLRNSISGDDFVKTDSYSNRASDCDDDTLMVTSNDALRFEEDCLFENPSPSCRSIPSRHTLSGAGSSANRFLCQKNSTADMTLAQLNDSNASDTSHNRVTDLTDLKMESLDPDQNFDPLMENFLNASKPLNSLLTKEPVVSRPLPSKQNNACQRQQQPLFVVKVEKEGLDVAIKREIKTENVSPVKCSLRTPKALKRSLASSVVALNEAVDVKEESNDTNRLRTSTSCQSHESPASVSSNSLLPLGKKIKLEITEVACNDVGNRVVTNDLLPSKSVMSDDENGADSDDLSDTESVLSKGSSAADPTRPNGSDKRYFWQYNIQAKGPKEKRLCKNIGSSDPHVLKDFEDPVFDPGHSNVHFVHSGKARKGDGTDITPNPHKLLQIGSELKTLNGTIEEMMQATDFVTRTTTMKEKNKYASRVCRLKKKAQHEANKIKLQGLNEEHNQLMSVLNSIKSKLREERFNSYSSNDKRHQSVVNNVNFTDELDNLTKSCLKVNVAGRADDYVSSVLLESSTNADKDDIWLYSD